MLSNDKVQTRFHQVEKNHCVWGSELGPVLCRKKGRYVELIRLHIPVNCMELHWRQPCSDPVAPCVIKKGRGQKKEKERNFASIQMLHTHTPSRSRVNPERQEKEKSGHKRRANDQNSAGSGTNLHGETDLTKTEHTPKPHDTLRRGTKGELETKWGTSWWQTRETKTIN